MLLSLLIENIHGNLDELYDLQIERHKENLSLLRLKKQGLVCSKEKTWKLKV